MDTVIYSVYVLVDDSIHIEWMDWMARQHIPDVLASNFFLPGSGKIYLEINSDIWTKNELLCRHSFVIHYFAETIKHLEEYQRGPGVKRREEFLGKYVNTTKTKRFIGEVITV